MLSAEVKSARLLTLYSELVNGSILNKAELAQRFHVTERSIQRDIEALRCFFAEQMLSQDIIYDRKAKGYRLTRAVPSSFTNSELLAVCKILLESRSMVKEEMYPLLDKLLDCCAPEENRRTVQELLANEKFHYVEPHHGRLTLPGLWELGEAVQKHKVLEIEYRKMNGKEVVTRIIEPAGLMFSEYYFYLVGFIRNEDKKQAYDSPAIYRADRIVAFRETGEHFHAPYSGRFQEGEFRKRVQFMYGGKLEKIRFRYTGPSIEAVLDRLPTAVILEEDESGWLVEAEVFGKGIEMWLRSQGEYIYKADWQTGRTMHND